MLKETCAPFVRQFPFLENTLVIKKKTGYYTLKFIEFQQLSNMIVETFIINVGLIILFFAEGGNRWELLVATTLVEWFDRIINREIIYLFKIYMHKISK